MSEFQYIGFRGVDAPLSDDQLGYMERQSSRAEVTRWSFDNTYHYGDAPRGRGRRGTLRRKSFLRQLRLKPTYRNHRHQPWKSITDTCPSTSISGRPQRPIGRNQRAGILRVPTTTKRAWTARRRDQSRPVPAVDDDRSDVLETLDELKFSIDRAAQGA